MKKNYITPEIKLATTEFYLSSVNASFKTGDDYQNGHNTQDTDGNFDVDSKNRFYNDSDDGWE